MSRRTPIEDVLHFLGVDDPELLRRLRAEGLFADDLLDAFEADELRIATLLVSELGVNEAGVHVALHLRRRLLVLQQRLRQAAEDSDRER